MAYRCHSWFTGEFIWMYHEYCASSAKSSGWEQHLICPHMQLPLVAILTVLSEVVFFSLFAEEFENGDLQASTWTWTKNHDWGLWALCT